MRAAGAGGCWCCPGLVGCWLFGHVSGLTSRAVAGAGSLLPGAHVSWFLRLVVLFWAGWLLFGWARERPHQLCNRWCWPPSPGAHVSWFVRCAPTRLACGATAARSLPCSPGRCLHPACSRSRTVCHLVPAPAARMASSSSSSTEEPEGARRSAGLLSRPPSCALPAGVAWCGARPRRRARSGSSIASPLRTHSLHCSR